MKFITLSEAMKNRMKDKDLLFILIITIAFIASRFVIQSVGVSFHSQFIKRMWQSIDVVLLQTKLLESIFYSHAQPPLFNLFNGLVLKIFPIQYPHVFHFLSLLMGWLSCTLLYRSFRLLNVSRWISLVASLYFMLSPIVILFENHYSYTYVIVFLITLSSYLLIRFVVHRRFTDWLLLWCTLCSITLIRSSYHLFWLFFIALIFIFLYDKKLILSKRFIMGMVIPIAIVFGWYVKNKIVFGTFSSSTWIGMNMARIMPLNTELGKIGPFKSAETYTTIHKNEAFADVELLHNECKTNSGYINYFHIDYISISDEFKREVLTEIKQHPARYVDAVGKSIVAYFNPSTHAPFIDDNYVRIKNYARIFNLDFSDYTKFKPNQFTMGRAWPVAILYISLGCVLVFCFRQNAFTNHEVTIVIMLLFMLLYILAVSNLFEFGENNRFRFETLPMFLILFVKTVDATWKLVSRRILK